MNNRLQSLIASLSSQKVDALIVNRDVNIQYLTNFPAHESWLLVSRKGCFYITDARYTLEAEKGLSKGIKVVRFPKSMFETVIDLAGQLKLKNIGFDSRHISLAQYHFFKKNVIEGVKLIEADNLVEILRETKDKNEILMIREALRHHQQALRYIKTVVKPGVTEKFIFSRLDNWVKARGLGHSFDPIIASGPNSCLPHAKVTDRKVKNNELVLLDFGIDYKGYKSDLTRMCFLGRMPQLVLEINEKVRLAQQKAIRAIKSQVSCSFADAQARNYLKECKLDQYFGHSLGHGVGLEIHESPRLSQASKSVLREGMVVTVEPAVYIPHKFGIRLEEMVLVKKTDCEVLSGNID